MRQDIKFTVQGTLIFSKIDPQIEYVESQNRIILISVPKDSAIEIIAKLKAHPAVTSVNSELTPFGRSINFDLRPPLAGNPHTTFGITATQPNAHTRFNPDAPQPIHTQWVNPDAPPLMNPQEREGYVVRICIAARREFDLRTVDSRINHDKPWGERDWDQGHPAATSCEIPAIHQSEIIAKLMRNPAVIFAKGPLEAMDLPRRTLTSFKP